MTIVESAIILLMFFMLLFGVIEAGRFLSYRQVLTNAAREGARFGIAPLTQTDTLPDRNAIETKVNGYLAAAHITGATTTVTCPTLANDPGATEACDVRSGAMSVSTGSVVTQYKMVTVTKPYSVITIPGFFNMLTITLRGESLMRRETSD